MNLNTAKKIYTEVQPHIEKLQAALKELRSQLKPAKEFIQEHMIDNNIASMTVGNTVFKTKTSMQCNINKSTLEASVDIDENTKNKIIKNNTCSVVKVLVSKKK